MNRPLPPRAAFVLVNWNTRELLLDALARLRPLLSSLPAEAVVVDNASRDGSAEAVRRRFPEIALIANGSNDGFARAVNRGIGATIAPIVCLLNPDVLVEEAPVSACLDRLDGWPGVAALGPTLLAEDGNPWVYPDTFPTFGRLVWRELWPWKRTDRLSPGRSLGGGLGEVDWLAGACLFLRRRALEEAGGLDERFFLYKEDVDLCLRLRRAGWSVVRCEEARLRHLVAQSTRTNPGPEAMRARLEGLRSSVLYARKHWGGHSAFLLALLLRASLLARLGKVALQRLVRPRGDEALKLRWMREALRELTRPVPRTDGQEDEEMKPALRTVA